MSFEELKKAPKEEVVISIPTVTKNLLPNKFFRVSVRIAILLQGFNYKLGIRKYHNSIKLSVRKYLRIRSEEAWSIYCRRQLFVSLRLMKWVPKVLGLFGSNVSCLWSKVISLRQVNFSPLHKSSTTWATCFQPLQLNLANPFTRKGPVPCLCHSSRKNAVMNQPLHP